jgi:uncharacterized membrane protein YfcA
LDGYVAVVFGARAQSYVADTVFGQRSIREIFGLMCARLALVNLWHGFLQMKKGAGFPTP